jgi:hypothetical protein
VSAGLTRARTRQPRTYFTPEGTLYTIHGPGGAVSLVIPGDPVADPEPVLIHSRTDIMGGTGHGSCSVLPEGECWADAGWRGGADAYEKYLDGGEDALYAELEEWYVSRFGEVTT